MWQPIWPSGRQWIAPNEVAAFLTRKIGSGIWPQKNQRLLILDAVEKRSR